MTNRLSVYILYWHTNGALILVTSYLHIHFSYVHECILTALYCAVFVLLMHVFLWLSLLLLLYIVRNDENKDDQSKKNLFTNFLAEHNVPLSVADHFGSLLKKMCPDSEIAKKYACTRTKTGSIVCTLADDDERTIREAMKNGPFSIATDGSTDYDDIKLLWGTLMMGWNVLFVFFCALLRAVCLRERPSSSWLMRNLTETASVGRSVSASELMTQTSWEVSGKESPDFSSTSTHMCTC